MKCELTDPLSNEKILVYNKTVSELYFSDNNSLEYNTIDETIKFLQKAKKIVKKEEYKDVRVQGYTQDGDDNTLSSFYIRVWGCRLETDGEYRRRQEHIKIQAKTKYDSYKANENYYKHPDTLKKLSKLGII